MFLIFTSRSSGALHPELRLHLISASDKNISGLKSLITAGGLCSRAPGTSGRRSGESL